MNIDYLLYVEDDMPSCMVMKLLIEKTLSTTNYAIFFNSMDFMNKLIQLPVRPNIILLDIHITPLNGFQLLQMIREDPIYAHTKVVALTASVMNEEVKKLKQSGFDGAIGKPINLSTFASAIGRILNGESVWQI